MGPNGDNFEDRWIYHVTLTKMDFRKTTFREVLRNKARDTMFLNVRSAFNAAELERGGREKKFWTKGSLESLCFGFLMPEVAYVCPPIICPSSPGYRVDSCILKAPISDRSMGPMLAWQIAAKDQIHFSCRLFSLPPAGALSRGSTWFGLGRLQKL